MLQEPPVTQLRYQVKAPSGEHHAAKRLKASDVKRFRSSFESSGLNNQPQSRLPDSGWISTHVIMEDRTFLAKVRLGDHVFACDVCHAYRLFPNPSTTTCRRQLHPLAVNSSGSASALWQFARWPSFLTGPALGLNPDRLSNPCSSSLGLCCSRPCRLGYLSSV